MVGDDEAPDEIRWPDALRPALPTRAFAQQLRDLMQRAAERGVGPVDLARLGERLGRDDWPAAARFIRQYVAVLALRDATTRGSTAYDPAELVRAASGLLADDPALLAAERRRLDFVYVDELADTDPAQIELLSLVASGGVPAGRVRRPGLLGLRLPRRRPGGGADLPGPLPHGVGRPGRDDHAAHQLPGRAGPAGRHPPGRTADARPGEAPRHAPAGPRRPDR